jgi:DNA-binding response OmpR family regulator
MKIDIERLHLVLIDRQHSWLERSDQALRLAGFEVDSLNHYNYPPPNEEPVDTAPKLVILGCASIGQDEFDLINRILQHKDHLIVLSTALPRNVMRSVFLVGADDVANKPYDPNRLVTMVNQVLRSIPSDDR